MSKYLEGLPPEKKGNWLRKMAAVPCEKAGDWIDTHIPGISPNDISMIGVAMSFLSANYSETHAFNKSAINRAIEIGLYTATYTTDILDGALARVQKNTRGIENPSGVYFDALNDSAQQFAKDSLQMSSSWGNGDLQGEKVAYLAGVTTSIARLSSAYATSKGISVAEYRGPISTAIQTITWIMPEYKNINVHALGNGLMVAGNVVETVCNILNTIRQPNEVVIKSDALRNEAAAKTKVLAIAALGTIGLLTALHRKHKKTSLP